MLAGSPAALPLPALSPQPAATGTAASAAQTARSAPLRGRVGTRLSTADLRRGGARDRRAHAPDGTPPVLHVVMHTAAMHGRLRIRPPAPHRAPPAASRGGTRNPGRNGSACGPEWGKVCKLVCFVWGSGVEVPQRAGVEGLLPLLHPGSPSFTCVSFQWPSAAPSTTRSMRRTG